MNVAVLKKMRDTKAHGAEGLRMAGREKGREEPFLLTRPLLKPTGRKCSGRGILQSEPVRPKNWD